MFLSWALVGVIVAATTVGYLCQALGMRKHGEVHDFRPHAFSRFLGAIATNGWIIASVAAMAVSFFTFMALISIADLSFAVPATASSIIFETVLARLVLKETVDSTRWAGIALVACGVALLA